MQGKDFLFFLLDDEKRSYYRDDYGAVKISTLPTPLTISPDAFREISILVERNRKYFGLDRSFTIPLKYVEGGAAIVKYHYYTYGVMAKLNLIIAEQKLAIDDTEYGFYYDTLYTGQVDFSTFNHDGATVTCATIEGGLSKYLKANENTVYPIPLDVEQNVNIYNDGLNLRSSNNWLSINQTHAATSTTTGVNNLLWLFMATLPSEGTIFDTVQTGTAPLTTYSSNVEYNDNRNLENHFFQSQAEIVLRIKATVKVTMTNGNFVRLYILNSAGIRVVLFTLLGNNSSSGQTLTQTFNIDTDYNIHPGEKLYLISELSDSLGSAGGASVTYDEFSLNITYTSRYKPTLTKSLPAEYVLQQLVQKMSGGGFTAKSDWLRKSKIQVSCGDGLRQLAGAEIKTSLTQAFNSLNTADNLGLYIENNVLRLEEKGLQFDNSSEIFLGNADEYVIKPATEYLFNTIRIGWPNQDYEALNGRNELNTVYSYTTDVDVMAKELVLIGDWRTDPYGAEIARINLDGKKTTDSSTDNDVWMFKVGEFADGTYKLDRSLNATATGDIEKESIYNLYFWPPLCLLRHGWYIRSCLDKLDNTYLKFQTSDKNSNVTIGGVSGRDNILIGNLEPRKFIPVIFEVGIAPPEDLQEQLAISPIRAYTFNISGITYKGLSLSIGTEPATNKRQTYQLLADPSCDLKLLIDIYE